jgi:hypothetical protein
MPKGPNGQKRPADAIGLAVMIGKIATGEIDDATETSNIKKKIVGHAGGKARAIAVAKDKRTEIARTAASARWKKAKHLQS